MSEQRDEWDDILDPDEKVVWQGRPDPSVSIGPGNVAIFAFGLCFAGFALFWMIMASMAGGFFWMFGLIHFCVGVGLAFGGLLWQPWRRRHTWYTLTNKRAFIARDLPLQGRTLKSYPITSATNLEMRDGRFGSVIFDHEMKRRKNGYHKVDIGFERIEDAAQVFHQMRQIQEGQAG